jgi:hypothetical protein
MNKIDIFIKTAKDAMSKLEFEVEGEGDSPFVRKRWKINNYSFILYYIEQDDQLYLMVGNNGKLQGCSDINTKEEEKELLILMKDFLKQLIDDKTITYKDLEQILFELI